MTFNLYSIKSREQCTRDVVMSCTSCYGQWSPEMVKQGQ